MSKMANNNDQKNKKTPSAASTRQMDVWRTLMSQLTRALPTSGVVQLASNLTSPNHTHNSVNAFMAAFEAAKSGTEHTLITSSLVYKFRGTRMQPMPSGLESRCKTASFTSGEMGGLRVRALPLRIKSDPFQK